MSGIFFCTELQSMCVKVDLRYRRGISVNEEYAFSRSIVAKKCQRCEKTTRLCCIQEALVMQDPVGETVLRG